MSGEAFQSMPRLRALRYVTPLREGGSMPAVVDASDGASYVAKFRGAGQGVRVLVSEAIYAGLARTLGLPIPAAAVLAMDDGFGRGEPDPEIQDILRGSVGNNFGLAFVAGALAFDPAVDGGLLSPDAAADIVWLDALLTNVDRTPRNPNLLVSGGQVWLIDHGACLYFHYRWEGWQQRVQTPFPQIKEHVLLPPASSILAADERLRPRLSEGLLAQVMADLPDDWLGDEEELFPDLAAHRAAYVDYLRERLNGPRTWLAEAEQARQRGPERLSVRQTHRVE